MSLGWRVLHSCQSHPQARPQNQFRLSVLYKMHAASFSGIDSLSTSKGVCQTPRGLCTSHTLEIHQTMSTTSREIRSRERRWLSLALNSALCMLLIRTKLLPNHKRSHTLQLCPKERSRASAAPSVPSSPPHWRFFRCASRFRRSGFPCRVCSSTLTLSLCFSLPTFGIRRSALALSRPCSVGVR